MSTGELFNAASISTFVGVATALLWACDAPKWVYWAAGIVSAFFAVPALVYAWLMLFTDIV